MYRLALTLLQTLISPLLIAGLLCISLWGCATTPHSNDVISQPAPTTEGGYPTKNGQPIWFTNPSHKNTIGVASVAPQQKKGGMQAQKKVALAMAHAELAKQTEIHTQAELTIINTSTLRNGEETIENEIQTYSKSKAMQLIQHSIIKDQWLNPATGDLYLWVITNN